jgi:uncharacterized membrane protein YdjX (TVP38/TMEM64 family)
LKAIESDLQNSRTISTHSRQRHTPRRINVGITVLVVLALLLAFAMQKGWSLTDVRTSLEGLSDTAYATAFAILPLLGVPVSWFLIAAGAKYSIQDGLLMTAACMCLHNLVAYTVANSWLRGSVTQLLAKRGKQLPKIPEKHQTWFMVVFATVPGLPYSIKLYSLALTNMPFRKYFWLGWPAYVASSIIFIGFGDAAADMNGPLALLFGLCLVLGFVFTFWLKEKQGL